MKYYRLKEIIETWSPRERSAFLSGIALADPRKLDLTDIISIELTDNDCIFVITDEEGGSEEKTIETHIQENGSMWAIYNEEFHSENLHDVFG